MFSNYVKIAIRSILKNKLYAIINVLGLSVGLAIYLFGGLLSDYEYSHDSFFKNFDRIYTLRGNVSPQANIGVSQIDTVQSAVGPFIKSDIPDVDAVARTILREFLITVGEDNYYQSVRFTDPELLKIFDFDFIHGDETALDGSNGIIISETLAQKYFGNENPVGQSITLDHENDLTVMAVIRDIPKNSHFNSQILMSTPLGILIPMRAMERITEFQPDTNWGNTSSGNMTYVLLPPSLDQAWLQTQLDGIYERHMPDEQKEFMDSFEVRPLADANTAIWDMLGIPVITVVKLLGIIVLLIACVNYTNLATAQSMGRAREVGLRKTLGAGRTQLLLQFIVESLTITFFAMILALATLEIIIPLFNSATGKILNINYLNTLPWLLMTTMVVGILSGSYPAYVITKTSPIEALRDTARKGRAATIIRAIMISIQFTFSVCILAMVLVVYAQNDKVEESSRIFPKDQVYTLDRINVDQMTDRHEVLRNEMLSIPYVNDFTLSSQVPYEQTNSNIRASKILNDFSQTVNINQLNIDDHFVSTYDIPMVAGRNISRDIAMDTHLRSQGAVNVLINESAAKALGFSTPEAALNQVFYEDEKEKGITTYTIVGVMADRNILGLFNSVKPFFFFMRDASYRLASIKLSKNAPVSVVKDIEEVWHGVYPDYPMQGKFLNETFQKVYMIFDMGTKSLAVFAFIALFLAAIGLFGLAAFMAEQRTKEIGIRKVLGASNNQIVRLLIWQFSTPVLWATPIALILAYLASGRYLEFFAERIGLPYGMLLGAGLCGLLLSWMTVATHAFNIAKTNPINALHYE
ncbi:MAG: ABC transporter permease [Alphaproteobacteria bacterium]|nr:ABC transporter permease [Alphaproteobacteria bacterium]